MKKFWTIDEKTSQANEIELQETHKRDLWLDPATGKYYIDGENAFALQRVAIENGIERSLSTWDDVRERLSTLFDQLKRAPCAHEGA